MSVIFRGKTAISSELKNNEEEGWIIFVVQIKLPEIYWISMQLQSRSKIARQCANENHLGQKIHHLGI